MNKFKKLVALATFVAMIGTSAHRLSAQEYPPGVESFEETGGYGYEEARRVPSLAPAIALGTIAIVAIIAVLAQNNHHHDHGHDHSHN